MGEEELNRVRPDSSEIHAFIKIFCHPGDVDDLIVSGRHIVHLTQMLYNKA
jgi:hypothetical protein